MNSETLLEASNINFAYRDTVPLLENFNFRLKQGEFTALIGPNGAGKSTIAKILNGFLKPQLGTVRLKGVNINRLKGRERAGILANVAQSTHAVMPFTVRQIVEMGRSSLISRFSGLSHEDRVKINHAMETMDLSSYTDRRFSELSGGEKQRVMLALALAQGSEIIVLDEPSSALDIGHSFRLMQLLKELNSQRGLTILLISHDIQLAANFCSRILLMKNGRVLADGSPETVITSKNLAQAYNCMISVARGANGSFLLSPGEEPIFL